MVWKYIIFMFFSFHLLIMFCFVFFLVTIPITYWTRQYLCLLSLSVANKFGCHVFSMKIKCMFVCVSASGVCVCVVGIMYVRCVWWVWCVSYLSTIFFSGDLYYPTVRTLKFRQAPADLNGTAWGDWFCMTHHTYAQTHIHWARKTSMWQKSPDGAVNVTIDGQPLVNDITTSKYSARGIRILIV